MRYVETSSRSFTKFFLVLPNHLIELRFLGRLILDNESFKLYAQEGAIHVV